jgi:hypothetical protein
MPNGGRYLFILNIQDDTVRKSAIKNKKPAFPIFRGLPGEKIGVDYE